jgi:DNA-binding IclR family transcriptional regulator
MASLTTVHRSLEIVDLLLELDGAGPTAVAKRLDVPDSTAYDYLQSLCETKYVSKEGGEYRLSSYFLTIAGKMRYRDRLFEIAKPEMRRVAAETDELVGLTIEDEGMGIIFHEEEGERALSLGTYPGAAIPLHTIAAGKAILAHLPDERVASILDRRGLPKRTDQTITDRDRLSTVLERVRADGYAIDWDEQVVGMGMIAVPLLVEGEVLGSVAIVAPTSRIRNDSYQQELLGHAREMEDTITVSYRYGE